MWINYVLLGAIGLFSGVTVSAGIFALISAIGILPRMAGKTHTGKNVKLYEDFVAMGGTMGNIFMLFPIEFLVGSWLGGVYGVFSGIFVGCLVASLAETLNSIAVFTRRVKLKIGISYIVLSVALGKLIGAFLYFYKRW